MPSFFYVQHILFAETMPSCCIKHYTSRIYYTNTKGIPLKINLTKVKKYTKYIKKYSTLCATKCLIKKVLKNNLQ